MAQSTNTLRPWRRGEKLREASRGAFGGVKPIKGKRLKLKPVRRGR